MPIERAAVQAFLERLGAALTAGDAAAAARCWEVPALVVGDDNVLAVGAAGEVEQFFAGATQWYRAQGLVATRPEILRLEPLGDRLAAALVRWPTFDAAGAEQASERSYYMIRLGDDGEPRIRVAATVTPANDVLL